MWTADGCGRDQDHEHLLLTWANQSERWNDTTLFDKFVCGLSAYLQMRNARHSAEAIVVCVVGLLGTAGSLASCLLFSRKSFRRLDFVLYRLMAVLELLHMSIMHVVRQLQLLDGCRRTFSCAFFRAHLHLAITNTCAEAVDLLVLFLTTERAVACLLPRHFRLVHRRVCYRTVAAVALLLPLLFNAAQALEVRVVSVGHDGGQFDYEPSPFADSAPYKLLVRANVVRAALLGAALTLATLLSLVGLAAAERRKRQLRRRSLPARVEESKKLKRTLDFCCLQLCSAVPVLLNCVVYALSLHSGLAVDVDWLAANAFRPGVTHPDAMQTLRQATHRQHLRFLTNVTNILAHASHFYLYCLFCAEVRRATRDMLSVCCCFCVRPTARLANGQTSVRRIHSSEHSAAFAAVSL